MITAPFSPTMSTTSSTRTKRESRNTGFPEPFCGERNTTWPHPEADLSPNASLCSEDIDPNRITIRQQRRSFFSKNGKRTISHGKVIEDRHRGLALALADPQSPPSREGLDGEETKARASKDSTDSLQSQDPPSPSTSSHKKRNLLRKIWPGAN